MLRAERCGVVSHCQFRCRSEPASFPYIQQVLYGVPALARKLTSFYLLSTHRASRARPAHSGTADATTPTTWPPRMAHPVLGSLACLIHAPPRCRCSSTGADAVPEPTQYRSRRSTGADAAPEPTQHRSRRPGHASPSNASGRRASRRRNSGHRGTNDKSEWLARIADSEGLQNLGNLAPETRASLKLRPDSFIQPLEPPPQPPPRSPLPHRRRTISIASVVLSRMSTSRPARICASMNS